MLRNCRTAIPLNRDSECIPRRLRRRIFNYVNPGTGRWLAGGAVAIGPARSYISFYGVRTEGEVHMHR